MVAAAMLDRLLHRSIVLNITGESCRMRAHRARATKLRTGNHGPHRDETAAIADLTGEVATTPTAR